MWRENLYSMALIDPFCTLQMPHNEQNNIEYCVDVKKKIKLNVNMCNNTLKYIRLAKVSVEYIFELRNIPYNIISSVFFFVPEI